LGALAGFAATERVGDGDMPELERFVLHRLAELDAMVRRCGADYDFHALFTALHNFCAVDLSAFYFDVRKDWLYCDAASSLRRRATRTVLDRVFDCLVRWLAPLLCFTAEEAWLARHGASEETSVHLELYPEVPARWHDPALAEKWAAIRDLRRVVTGAIELARGRKELGSSLQAAAEIFADPAQFSALDGVDLAEICITSSATLVSGAPPEGAFTLPELPGIGVRIGPAPGEKCQRCWRILPEVGSLPDHPDLCRRCADVVERAAAAPVGGE
jgi:isoleucyl-tRNA synthetase